MFLKRFIFINWGNVPTIEFEFGPVNLFSGGNGSGKTTAADAVQTIMTAAHENLFQYNPGQDETTQRGRGGKRVRTLASYVLGCDDGSYARLEPSDGYLAAVFYPNKHEDAEPFTALIAVRAWLDRGAGNMIAREEQSQFYILPGVELEQHFLVRPSTDGKRLLPLTDFQTESIKQWGKRRVERYDGKKAYLRRLYGALRGKRESVADAEAIAAARAFSRFMAYKPVKSINRFVAEEILERKDLGEAIRSVSSQLKTIHAMERDAAQLIASIEILDQARFSAHSYIDYWIELKLLDYTLAEAEYQLRQRDYLQGREQQKNKREALAETDKAIAAANEEAKATRQQLILLEAQRQGVDALKRKDQLEAEGAQLNQTLISTVRQVLEHDQLVSANIRASEAIRQSLADADLQQALPEADALQATSIAARVADSAKQVLPEIHNLLQQDAVGTVSLIEQRGADVRAVQTAHNHWHEFWSDNQGDGSRRDAVLSLVQQRRARYNALKTQRDEKQREIARLDADQVVYPKFVDRALAAIRAQCPDADPRVLCDHVEVMDPRWQAAIEGYIGGARFSVLVEQEFEAEAIRIVRRLPGRDNRARVIQGKKALADAARITLDNNSIVHVLEFSHAVARAYLLASYGSVLRVDSAQALRSTRRGLTEDGMGSGNYSMYRCDLNDSELVFGAAARQRALVAKQAELAEIEVEWNQANDRMQRAESLLRAIDGLRISCYADALDEVRGIQQRIDENTALLEHLDLSEHQELEARLADLQAKSDALRGREAELNATKGSLQTELATIEKQLRALSDLQESNREQVEACEEVLQGIAGVWTEVDMDARLNAADEEARTLNREFANNQRVETEKQLHAAERRVAEGIHAHNQSCRPSDAIMYMAFSGDYGADLFKAMCETSREIDRVHNILKNNILVEKRSALAELKDAFNNAFVTHLCHTIYQALGEGKRQIDLLNKELQHHRFGADQETFRFASEWVPEFRDYARFLEEVVKSPGLGDETSLFEAKLSARSVKVRDDLMSKLTADDEARAMRDLELIADYRNYRRYEIYKEVAGKEPIPLSEYGTGSGGQLETPAYIIRSAAITSAFRFADGGAHLRMVLVDEAFSKMDETRSREVIKYLSESLGLQLVFIMPTSKCGPYMDLISNEFVFAKVPSDTTRGQLSTRILVDRKTCNQARIRELWETHRRNVYQQAQLDFMEEFAQG